ncbi:MAG: ABC transporter permease [Lactobacillus sp.]|jgi:ABC-2 type transport system permease protein|nr:ABC transporter permease [Lactobacillus sp.]
MHKFWIMTGQVYRKNLKSGAWLFLVLSPIIFIAIIAGISLFMNRTATTPKIAVVSDNASILNFPKQQAGTADFTLSTPIKAKQALIAQKIDGILSIKTSPAIKATYTARSDSKAAVNTQQLDSLVTQLKQAKMAKDLHLSTTESQQLLTPAHVATSTVDITSGKPQQRNPQADNTNRKLAIIFAFLVTLIVTIYGGMIAQEIANEKDSRIMEILMSSVSATTQFFAKITAVLGLLLTQIAVYVVAGSLAWHFLKDQPFIRHLTATVDFSIIPTITTLIITAFFIFNILLFVELAAMMGVSVSSKDQLNSATMPVSSLSMIGFFLAISAQSNDAVITQIASYLPFINVGLMPLRLALGHTTLPHAFLSLTITVVSLAIFTYIAVKTYEKNVLQYSNNHFLKHMQNAKSVQQFAR